MRVFEDMDENLFRQLYPKMELVRLDPGAPLYKMGDDDTAAFFVKTGSVRPGLVLPGCRRALGVSFDFTRLYEICLCVCGASPPPRLLHSAA